LSGKPPSGEPPSVIKYHPTDIVFSMVMIAGFALIHSYCQYLFLGPCNINGSNFPLGLFLMIMGGAGLVFYRIGLVRKRIIAKILVFTEGTLIREVRDGHGRMTGGTKLGNASAKLKSWNGQGAQIMYLTSKRTEDEIEAVRRTLKTNGFPKGRLYYRNKGEEYKDVAENALPDVIVESDCAGIGGEREMTYPHIRPDIRRRIVSVVVREFEGIDHLPESLQNLLRDQT